MSSNSWSLLLSALGLVLGFISAYGQIKGFFVRFSRFGKESASQWWQRRGEKIQALATYPSALIAYLARSFMFILATMLGAFVIVGLLHVYGIGPLWLQKGVLLIASIAIGTEFGSLHPTIIDVSRKALWLASKNRKSG
jgi:hypothetical protein